MRQKRANNCHLPEVSKASMIPRPKGRGPDAFDFR